MDNLERHDYTVEELMAYVISREINNGELVAVGTLSPVPATGSILAKMTHAPEAELLIWMIREYWPFTEGVKEFFDLAQKGRVDLFFLGGAQIDQFGNTNLNVLGNYHKPKVRLPGGAGTGTLYFTVPRVVLFKMDHTKRSFVEKVDFITGAGISSPGVFRKGGAVKCVTPLAVLGFDGEKGKFFLNSVHPGKTVEKVVENTGFELVIPPNVPFTPVPGKEELNLLRTKVKEKIKEAYPLFAMSAFLPA